MLPSHAAGSSGARRLELRARRGVDADGNTRQHRRRQAREVAQLGDADRGRDRHLPRWRSRSGRCGTRRWRATTATCSAGCSTSIQFSGHFLLATQRSTGSPKPMRGTYARCRCPDRQAPVGGRCPSGAERGDDPHPRRRGPLGAHRAAVVRRLRGARTRAHGTRARAQASCSPSSTGTCSCNRDRPAHGLLQPPLLPRPASRRRSTGRDATKRNSPSSPSTSTTSASSTRASGTSRATSCSPRWASGWARWWSRCHCRTSRR